ncbi:MAG: aldo/keto reductase [Candidatus Micrarchaeaceae archaeon]
MEMCELGRTGEKIPVIGMGTWKLEKTSEGIESLKYGIDAGMRFIDTAEMYGNEEVVGQAIKGIDGVFVATKVSPDHFHYDDVLKSCDASLKKLGVKQIDLYQLHWPNTGVDIKETMSAMEKLADEGKIRYIGVSNFSIDEMIEAQEAMKRYDIVSNQLEYSIITREIESGLLKFCNDVGATVIAYSPLARAKLLDKRYEGLLSVLDSIGKQQNKTALQVALNWVISHRGVVAIPKALKKRHILENAGAAEFSLSRRDLGMIAEALKQYPEVRPIAGNLKPLIKKTSSLWSKVIRYREAMRGTFSRRKRKGEE